uniref:Restriction endonuclease type IV Mrr domain-containing protein n=1 Tax=Clytia hemisphaerica TaxID=252671 RepID=A0A7M5X060_9CNID|eukprot:TCONS_00049060-protein
MFSLLFLFTEIYADAKKGAEFEKYVGGLITEALKELKDSTLFESFSWQVKSQVNIKVNGKTKRADLVIWLKVSSKWYPIIIECKCYEKSYLGLNAIKQLQSYSNNLTLNGLEDISDIEKADGYAIDPERIYSGFVTLDVTKISKSIQKKIDNSFFCWSDLFFGDETRRREETEINFKDNMKRLVKNIIDLDKLKLSMSFNIFHHLKKK